MREYNTAERREMARRKVPHGLLEFFDSGTEDDVATIRLAQRGPTDEVITGLANRMARTVWAILADGRMYHRHYADVQPA